VSVPVLSDRAIEGVRFTCPLVVAGGGFEPPTSGYETYSSGALRVIFRGPHGIPGGLPAGRHT